MPSNLPTIKRNGHFKALMLVHDTLEDVCRTYLATAATPNVAGLCAALGSTPLALRRLFNLPPEEYSNKDPKKPHPEAMAILSNTIMQIEATIVENGLTGQYNAHMSKFILSAFHERHEKQLNESTTDKQITITVQSEGPITLEELREMDRLETLMEEQQRLELVSMGKIADTGKSIAPTTQHTVQAELEVHDNPYLV